MWFLINHISSLLNFSYPNNLNLISCYDLLKWVFWVETYFIFTAHLSGNLTWIYFCVIDLMKHYYPLNIIWNCSWLVIVFSILQIWKTKFINFAWNSSIWMNLCLNIYFTQPCMNFLFHICNIPKTITNQQQFK